jgi:hypothetical protein
LELDTASELLLEEQAVAAEAFALAQDGGVGDTQVAGDLAVAAACEEPEEELGEQLGLAEPVGGGEGL